MTFLDDLKKRSEEELIEEGRTLASTIDRSQLRLGRLALAFAPMGERGTQSGAMTRTKMYAEAINIDPEALYRYRGVAHAWSQFDIKESEFQYSLLKMLAPVAEKEKVLTLLRKDKPAEGWGIQTALDAVQEAGLMPKKKGGISQKSKTVFERLHEIRIVLKNMSLLDHKDDPPKDKKRLGDSIYGIQSQTRRLLSELTKEDEKRVTKDSAKTTQRETIKK